MQCKQFIINVLLFVNYRIMRRLLLPTVLLLSSVCIDSQLQNPDLKLVAEWKNLEFSFPSAEDRTNAIAQGKFIATNVVPIDVDVHYSGKLS